MNDLHAADAGYHNLCSVNFRTFKDIPQQFQTEEIKQCKKPKLGRPQDVTRSEAFLHVVHYFEENDEEQMSIRDLIAIMESTLEGTGYDAYGFTHMKTKLQEYFGDKIIIAEINGRPNVITLTSTAKQILHDFYFRPRQDDPGMEKLRIIETAGILIKNELKSVKQAKDVYPTAEDMSSVTETMKYIPQSLSLLLKAMFVSKDVTLKVAAIGQAIMQASRPRTCKPPLQIRLAVQMHHHFASRFLVDTLNSLGFCSSYSEVQRLERSAAIIQGTDIPVLGSGQFGQFVADNVDHNIRTIDGKDMFHGMGMIATITPGKKQYKIKPIADVSNEEIIAAGRIDIIYFKSNYTNIESLTYKVLTDVNVEDVTRNIDLLWKASLLIKNPSPAWSGMMQIAHKGKHSGKSSVYFLHMIDMDPF